MTMTQPARLSWDDYALKGKARVPSREASKEVKEAEAKIQPQPKLEAVPLPKFACCSCVASATEASLVDSRMMRRKLQPSAGP